MTISDFCFYLLPLTIKVDTKLKDELAKIIKYHSIANSYFYESSKRIFQSNGHFKFFKFNLRTVL